MNVAICLAGAIKFIENGLMTIDKISNLSTLQPYNLIKKI